MAIAGTPSTTIRQLPMSVAPRHVAMIGVGAAGLVIARELRLAGLSMVLFEQGDQMGGT
jgi:NADPH-dependent 2,4-dienoyl-CoA reductase/sulfur reductase-like enzyme